MLTLVRVRPSEHPHGDWRRQAKFGNRLVPFVLLGKSHPQGLRPVPLRSEPALSAAERGSLYEEEIRNHKSAIRNRSAPT
jgi:hypothetical protein